VPRRSPPTIRRYRWGPRWDRLAPRLRRARWVLIASLQRSVLSGGGGALTPFTASSSRRCLAGACPAGLNLCHPGLSWVLLVPQTRQCAVV
jgi:hypothetical protein